VNPFEKEDLATRVAGSIRDLVSGSKPGDPMPSLRAIALQFNVSVPTVSAAFSLLEAEGLVRSGGERRRWKAGAAAQMVGKRTTARRSAGNPGEKKLLYLTSYPMREWKSSALEVHASLGAALSAEGWQLVHRVTGHEQAKHSRKSWDELFREVQPDAMVALTGNRVLAGWAIQQPTRMLFLGGTCDPHPLPMVKIGISGPLEELIWRLIDLGHRHIVLPLCGRNPEFVRAMKAVIRRSVAARSGCGAEVHELVTPYSTPDVLYDALHKHWRQHRPDALILLDWREFVTAGSFFRDAGVTMPGDLSVALLSNDNSMSWHVPQLSHYELNTMKLAKAVVRWTVKDPRSAASELRITMRATWREGGSIRDRR
jgi:DNA-binding LacI/PurR family transcriptional regulator